MVQARPYSQVVKAFTCGTRLCVICKTILPGQLKLLRDAEPILEAILRASHVILPRADPDQFWFW